MDPAKDKLEEWVRRISRQEMPVLDQTARELAKVTTDETSSLGEVAKIVLPYLSKEVRDLIGPGPFFIAAVLLKNKAIGLFYADRHSSGRELDAESFESFRHITQQANLCLAFME